MKSVETAKAELKLAIALVAKAARGISVGLLEVRLSEADRATEELIKAVRREQVDQVLAATVTAGGGNA